MISLVEMDSSQANSFEYTLKTPISPDENADLMKSPHQQYESP